MKRSIGPALKAKIEVFTEKTLKSNPMFNPSNIKNLKPIHIQNYIYNLWETIKYSPVHLKNAELSSAASGSEILVEFFKKKYKEEVGHDQWALDDLNFYRENSRAYLPLRTMPSISELIHYLGEISQFDPLKYVIYANIIEYFTVLVSPQWVANLKSIANVPDKSLTVITKHEEADRYHTADNFNVIDELFEGQTSLEPYLGVVDTFDKLFSTFCEELFLFGNQFSASREPNELRI